MNLKGRFLMLKKTLKSIIVASVILLSIFSSFSNSNASAETLDKKWIEKHQVTFYYSNPNSMPKYYDYHSGYYAGQLTRVDQYCSKSPSSGNSICYGFYSGWAYLTQ